MNSELVPLTEAVETLAGTRPRRFRTYPAHRPSGVEWFDDMPEHWGVRKLKFLAALTTRKKEGDGVKIGLENVESYTGRYLDTEATFEGDGVSFQAGDILYGKLRPYLAKVLLADSNGSAVGDFFVLRPGPDVLPRYLQYRLLERAFTDVSDGSTFGAKMPRVDWKFLGNLKFTLPPLDEQRAIAAFLDRETARIDGLVEKKRRLVALLKEKRTALISRAVTKGLNPAAPMKPSGTDWLDEYPARWTGLPLKWWVLTKITDGPHETPPLVNEGIDFVSAEAVQDGRINFESRRGYITEDLHNEYCRKCKPGRDDIFLVKSGATTGKVAYIDFDREFSVWSPLAQIRADRRRVEPRFLYVALQADYLQDQIRRTWSAGTQPNIAMRAIERLFVVAPSLPEQNAILEALNAQLGGYDALIEKIEAAILNLNEYRSALISAAVTGKIDVRAEVA